MNLLFVSHCYPWPLKTGTAQRVFHLLEGFVARHEVTLVTVHRFKKAPEPGLPLREQVRLIEVTDPTIGRRMDNCDRSAQLRALISSPFPLAVQLWQSRELLRVLRDIGRNERFDAVWVERSYIAEIAREAGLDRLVVDLDDLETRLQLQKIHNSAWYRPHPLAYAELAKLYAYERLLPRRFWRLVVCKEEDRRFFGRSINSVFIVPNGTMTFPASPPEKERSGELLFVGALGYGPNAEAAIHFHDHVLPKVNRLHPGARFVIVGMDAPARVMALDNGKTCSVANSVPDVAPYYETAAVVVVPLRQGSGTRLKLLEALARGKAVVATSVGAEGLDLRPGVDFELADDSDSFARACARLLHDPRARRGLAESGRDRVLSRYSWDRVAESAEQAIVS